MNHRNWNFLGFALLLGPIAHAAGVKDAPNDPNSAVVNWNPPSKEELVSRAISDGMTDPAKIVEWAKSRDVKLTVKEVRAIKAKLKTK